MGLRLLGIFAASALCAAPLAAHAADVLPPIEPVDVAVANAAHDWTGVYAGLNAGYAVGDFNTFTTASGESFDGDGALGGFQIGYNRQLGSVVLGAEGDVQAAAVESDGPADASLDWFSTIRGRIGYAFDSTMIYGTAGGAAAGIDTESGGNETAWGLAAGAGLEHALTESLTLKAEYLYLDVEGDEPETTTGEAAGWDGHVMRFGANLKF